MTRHTDLPAREHEELRSRADKSPVLRVVRGEPTPEELAALVAVLAARFAANPGPGDTAAPPASAWRDRRRYVRRPLTPGPAAWRASAWPSS